MKKLICTGLLAVSLVSTSASAWTRYGGDWSCGMVTMSQNSPPEKAQFQAWSMGFISALNDLTQSTWQNPPDQYGIWQAVVLHCQNNPLDDLYTSASTVWLEIQKREKKL